jgi:AcrR family transcriptional regulator
VGAFYSRFKDKEGLFHALYERWLEQATATTDIILDPERWEGASIPELLTAVVEFLVNVYRERGGLIRAFVVRNHVDPEFQARQERLSLYISERLTALLLERRGEIGHPNPERAARFGVTLLFGTLESAMLFADFRSRTESLDDETLATELTHAYLAYLGVS